MKRILFGLITFLFLANSAVFAEQDLDGFKYQQTMFQSTQVANQCGDLDCVRKQIDTIDAQLVNLLSLRFAFVRRAGELKTGNMPINDEARNKSILATVSLLAKRQGIPMEMMQNIFQTILTQSIQFEESYQTKQPPQH